jgi:Arc/MetJ-type ribon-helix-helix transcriptional regulator
MMPKNRRTKDFTTTGSVTSKRTPVRLSFRDKQLLDKTLGQTIYSARSEVVRAALLFLRDVWKLKDQGKRIVVRNDKTRLQYELFLAAISAQDLERGKFSRLEAAEREGRVALVADDPQNGDAKARQSRARQGIIFEIRTSPNDLETLNEIVDRGIAPTPSQAIRTSLEVYGHAVNRCLGGYRIAAQDPSGDLHNVQVPGISISDEKAIVFLVNDREIEREEIENIIRGRGNVTPVSYMYEENLGLESNLIRALDKARTLVNSGVRHFLIDLCWAVTHQAMAAEFVDPLEWGIVPSTEHPADESIATFAGFKFIEAVVWEPWAKDITINYSTARWYDLMTHQKQHGLSFSERERVFNENVGERTERRGISITPFVNPERVPGDARDVMPTDAEVDQVIQELERHNKENKKAAEAQVPRVAAITTAAQAGKPRPEEHK